MAAKRSTHVRGPAAESAQLRLARLAPLTPQALPLARRSPVVNLHGQIQMPAAHPSVPVPLLRKGR